MENVSQIKGEVAGSFLLGISESFARLNIITESVLNVHVEAIEPTEWYPCHMLRDLLQSVKDNYPNHQSIFFNAGINFLKIWYEQGPGKNMINSGLDWLYANAEGQGYNTVVRGTDRNEVGWCKILTIDEQAGRVIYENVTMLPPAIVKGVFYGGCLIFDDMDFVSVDTEESTFPLNPLLTNIIVTVRFRLKTKNQDLDFKIRNMQLGESLPLDSEELESLKWRYKYLLYKKELDTEYSLGLNKILVDLVNKSTKLTKELEELNTIKDKFFTILAHDLRSPFQTFLSISDILDTEIESLSKDKIKDFSHELNTTLHRQYDLLTDLLEWSRMQIDNYGFNFELLNLSQLTTNVIETLAASAKQKEIEIRSSIQNNIEVRADVNNLKLVMRNLVSNSIKFSNNGGTIEISASVQGNEVKIIVADNGLGISKDELQKLFREDMRTTSLGTHGEKGTGLGLLLCKEIVGKHHGTIRVESELGKGSKFIITLPSAVS